MNRSNLGSFGTVLKGFRTRRGLTQHQLAEKLAVRRNTIGTWERGDFLPQSKGTILELAKHLYLDNQETRLLLEASLTALAPHWSVPLSRNLFFTGREEVLEVLHRQLGVDQAVVYAQFSALHGLGGVGKTQIALEYAHRYALEYRAVFWIGAETEEQMTSGLLRIAETLQLSERNDRDQQRIVAAVQCWLSTHSHWLLIYDNVEDLDLLQRFLPTVRSGAIIITTRNQALGTLAYGLKLSPMEPGEALLFLLRRVKAVALKESNGNVHAQSVQTRPIFAAAQKLVRVLGGLPLALDQAGAYIEETGCSINDYLCLYERQSTRMLDRRGNTGRDHPESVVATFKLSLERIEYEQPASADLLRVCALLHADAIPEEVFIEGATHLGPTLAPLASDPALFDAAIAVLRRFSLVYRQAEAHVLSLHRLVQEVLQTSLPGTDLHSWRIRVMAAISHLFPANEEAHPNYFQRCERLLPHAQACLAWREQGDEYLSHRIRLLTHVAAYMRRRSHLNEAETLYQQARTEAEHKLEPEHLLLADVLEGLADLRLLRARYEEAESLHQRALHIREQAFGGEHPLVTASLNGLATLYWRQGKYSEAASLYQRSLDIRKRAFGADHPQVANSLSQLAMILRVQGKYEQSESLYVQAFHIRVRAFDLADPQIGMSFYHLASLYLEQARYEEAKSLFVRAARIWEEVLGPEDLDMAFALAGLAKVLTEQGCTEEAEALFLHALRIRESVLGSDHPQIAVVHHGLANLARKQQKYAQAEYHYQQALVMQEKYLGQQHTDTAETLHDLALLRQNQGKLGEAIALAERVWKIRSQTLGNAHPKTVATRTLSAQLREELRDAQATEAPEQSEVEVSDRHQNNYVPSPLLKAADSSPEHDLLHTFLNICCELHPRAWCRSADLWQAYTRWVEEHQERYPLSRGAFAAQLKAYGCRADRTNTARIWRGVALVNRNSDGA